MLKRSVGAKLRRRFLDRVVSGPVAHTRKRYDKARRLCPHQRIGNVAVHGEAAFTQDVAKALTVLAEGYPYGYSLVQRYIYAIEPEGFAGGGETFSSAALGSFGARAEKTTSAGKLAVPAERYAAFLVRIAAQCKRARLYAPRSKRADLLGQKREERAMKLLLRSRGFA
jgi:hypothetical protein